MSSDVGGHGLVCDPKPGARCSADTRRELDGAQRKLAESRRALDRAPDSAQLQRQVRRDEAFEAGKLAAYDSAPRGQKDLIAEIESSADPNSPAVDELRTRLYIGRRTRVDQKKALVRSLGRSTEEEELEASKALNRLRHPDGGFTIHPATNREEYLGFFVSRYPEREFAIAASELRASHLRRFREANADLLSQPDHFIGGWHDPETGVVSLDVSEKTSSAEAARTIAHEHAQAAFFDAQVGQSVNVDPTARDRIAGITES